MTFDRDLTEEEMKQLRQVMYHRIDEIYARGIPAEDEEDRQVYDNMVTWLEGCQTLEDFTSCFFGREWTSYADVLDVDYVIADSTKTKVLECIPEAIEEYSKAFSDYYRINLY
jgi:hypothetical protein